MDNDWDLHAVVRGCYSATATAAMATTPTTWTCSSSNQYLHVRPAGFNTSPSSGPLKKDVELQDLFKELHEPCKPFFAPKSHTPFAVSPLPALNRLSNGRLHLKRPHQKPSQVAPAANTSSASQASRSKRRKSQLKKVCQVPAESLSSDTWAWRKYGQKPIKGSPYPRGYYRCSSSKGCLARKQVERNRSDPGMFIVTYTAEHNHPAPTHRNSLAGSTRQKPATYVEPSDASGDHSAASDRPLQPSSTSSTISIEEEAVPQSSSRGEHDDRIENDEDGEVDLSLMTLDDDLSLGLDKLVSDDGYDCFLDLFPSNFGLSWNIATNSTATAAGGS